LASVERGQLITIKGLRKQFVAAAGKTAALDDLSVEIETNSFFTLLGPSGCGKSTLLRCIAGLETPDDGEITIGGVTVFSHAQGIAVPANRRSLGMVFQSYAIWPHMTVYSNVAFPLEIKRLPNIRDRVMKALELVGLDHLAQQNASKLSGGQQQRVALARAIVPEPDVLLLDEPLSNLDAALRDQMRAELSKIQRTLGVTTIYVTHDQTEALSMSDRVALMSRGKFEEIASPEALYNHPKTIFAAQFIGGANIIDGVAQPQSDGSSIETEVGTLKSRYPGNGLVKVFVRPERLVPGEGLPGANAMTCLVTSRRFAGDTVELDLVPHGSKPGVTLRCRTSARVPAAIGTPLAVSIDPEDVRILA
jgi:iron(III) transport system ATP-binding protein